MSRPIKTLAIIFLSAVAGAAQGAPAPAKAVNPPDPPAPRLSFPLACRIGETCEVQSYVDRSPDGRWLDYRCGAQTNDGHRGTDIRLPDMVAQKRGVAVLAAAAGRVLRVREGMADISVQLAGKAAVAGQECGNAVVLQHGAGWQTSYCHLARGSVAVKPGDSVASGQPLGRVGLSGETAYPHLHFAVNQAGATVDPFSSHHAGCRADGADRGMWDASAARAMTYKPGVILNAGFAKAPVTMEAVEARAFETPNAQSLSLVAYVRAINLADKDIVMLTLLDPKGRELAAATTPIDRAKAEHLYYVGKKAPAGGWPRGRYKAIYTVLRAGTPVMQRTFSLAL